MRFLNSCRILISVLAAAASAVTVSAQVPLNSAPSRALGHARLLLTTSAPNLVEGRELNGPQGVAVDAGGGFVYVSDTFNNRILGWKNASSFQNGAFADIVIGQRDMMSTANLGPGSGFNSGLSSPTGIAVDSNGNVYVADSGNSRIVRYPKPFSQPDAVKLADMVIGQANFQSNAPNAGGISERSVSFASGNSPLRIGITFDAQGNLWVSDSGNHRILRYPASALGDNATSGPAANLVLGQSAFTTNAGLQRTSDINVRRRADGLYQPSGLAFDSGGRLFVVDGLNRALVFRPPFSGNGQAADRIMGIQTAPAQGQPAPAPINENTIGVFTSNDLIPAEGVFCIGNVPFIVDSGAHRILRYDPFDNWPPAATQFSPTAKAIIGQDAAQQTELRVNRGLAEPTNTSLFSPAAAVFAGGETFIADAGNNRVIVMGDISTGPLLSTSTPYNARRVLGQISFEFRSINLIEGREFQFANAGIVIDNTSDPPRLYVADTANNRVLGFSDARVVRQGTKADIVIGQPDFFRALANYPSNNANTPNDSGLNLPVGLSVDRDGNLWVADAGNSRVLRFPQPFKNSPTLPKADLVLGQASFTAKGSGDASARSMLTPYGMTFSYGDGGLLVSDAGFNRVLYFLPPFTSNMAAARIIGQPDANSTLGGNDLNRFNGPRHVAVDTDDRLYVSDFNNSRVLIFPRTALNTTDPRASFSLSNGVNRPTALFVSPVTGEVWVGNAGANQALRYPKFDTLSIGGDRSDFQIPAAAPLAITLDKFGNLYLADSANRVAIHYATLTAVNAANYLPRLTPGMWASLCPDVPNVCLNPNNRNRSYTFTDGGLTVASTSPLPSSLGDLQITINDLPAPMYFTSPQQINFLMPKDLPTSGTVPLELTQTSTGRVVAAAQLSMDVASPAFFTSNASGTGQIAAVNENGTINSGTSPVAPGGIISLYANGFGPVPGSPPDGAPAQGAISVPGFPDQPRVAIGGRFVQPSDILYSGLAPGAAGLWQINVRVPTATAPGTNVVVMTFRDIPSNNPQAPTQIVTTINVR